LTATILAKNKTNGQIEGHEPQTAHFVLPATQAGPSQNKRAISCQSTDGQSNNNSNTFYIEK
jgi:hypothetical protein